MNNRIETRLLTALERNDLDYIMNVILDNPDVLALTLNGVVYTTLIELAIHQDKWDLVLIIASLENVRKLNDKNDKFRLGFAITQAVRLKKDDKAIALLKMGVLLEWAETVDYFTPLGFAIQNNNEKMIKRLLKAGATITPEIIKKAKKNNPAILIHLWDEHCSRLSLQNTLEERVKKNPESFIEMALLTHSYKQLIELAKYNPDIFTISCGDGGSFFWHALQDNYLDIAYALADRLIDIYQAKNKLNEALMIAIVTDKKDKAADLLKKGADINCNMPHGNNVSTLHLAISQKNHGMVTFLLQHNAYLCNLDKAPNAAHVFTGTLDKGFIDYCTMLSDEALAEKILGKPTIEQASFLSLLADTKQYALLKKLLIQHDTLPFLRKKEDKTLLEWFATTHHWEIVQHVIENTPSSPQKSDLYNALLCKAIDDRQPNTIALLLQHGANLADAVTTMRMNNAYFYSRQLIRSSWNKYYDYLVSNNMLADAIKHDKRSFVCALQYIIDPSFVDELQYIVDCKQLNTILQIDPSILIEKFENETLLEAACLTASQEVIDVIINNRGKETDLYAAGFGKALLFSVSEKQIILVKKLLDIGILPSKALSSPQQNCLHIAIKKCATDILSLLLADTDAQSQLNENDQTPLEYALSLGVKHTNTLREAEALYHKTLPHKQALLVMTQGQQQPQSFFALLPHELLIKIASYLRPKNHAFFDADHLSWTKTRMRQITNEVQTHNATQFIKEYETFWIHTQESKQLYEALKVILNDNDENKSEKIKQQVADFMKNRFSTNTTSNNGEIRSKTISALLTHHLLQPTDVNRKENDALVFKKQPGGP